MQGFKPDWAEKIQRGRTKAFGRGFAKGYLQGFKESRQHLIQTIIHDIIHDGVLSMSADIDTIERVVEIVEAQEDERAN